MIQQSLTLFSFQLPPLITRILLDYFGWDKAKLLEKIFDGDQEKLFSEANITHLLAKTEVAGKRGLKRSSHGDDEEYCEVHLKFPFKYPPVLSLIGHVLLHRFVSALDLHLRRCLHFRAAIVFAIRAGPSTSR